MECSDSRSFIPTRFVAFACRYHPHPCASLPSTTRVTSKGRGLVLFASLSPRRLFLEWKRPGLSSSRGTPVYVPCSKDPGGTFTPGRLRRVDTAFRFSHSVGSRDSLLSRLNGTARTPAVYASQGGLLRHHARLASGRWPGFAGQDAASCRVPAKGFNHVSQHRIPLSQAFLDASETNPRIGPGAIKNADCVKKTNPSKPNM